MASGTAYDDISAIKNVLNNIASASTEFAKTMKLFDAVTLYGQITANQLLEGQERINAVLSNYKLSVDALPKIGNENVSINVPLSGLDRVNSKKMSQVILSQNHSYSNGHTLKVTLLESSAKRLERNDNIYVSNPLQMTVSDMRLLTVANATSGSSEITIVLRSIDTPIETPMVNFTTVCMKRKPKNALVENFTCPYFPHTNITHNCTNRIGTIVSICPFYRMTCGGFSANDTRNCRTIAYTSTETTCMCSLKPHKLSTNRILKAASVQSISENTRVLQLVAMGELVGKDFVNTFTAAPSLTSANSLEKVLIVIIMFSTLWFGGIGLALLCSWRKYRLKEKNANESDQLNRKKKSAQKSNSPAAVREYLLEYIHVSFPAVFRHKSTVHQFIEEIKRHHKYLSLFVTTEKGDAADNNKVFKAAEVLTIQGLLMFLLALFYDLQSPSDDGSCISWSSETSCLSRKSLLDSSQTYCMCSSTHTDDSLTTYACSYQENESTVREVLSIAILVSIVTALFLRPTECLFELIKSPRADSHKVQASYANIGRRVSNVTRRVSVAAMNATHAAMRSLGTNQTTQKVVGLATRILPPSHIEAQELARASLTVISNQADAIRTAKLREVQLLKAQMRMTTAANDHESEDDVASDGSEDSESKNDSSSTSGSDRTEIYDIGETKQDDKCVPWAANKERMMITPTTVIFKALSEDIAIQRRALKVSELDDFDTHWGIDPTGEFIRHEHLFGNCFKEMSGISSKVYRELELVKQTTQQKVNKLKLATDDHTGLEILHLFVLDLLGRDTPAANIFTKKSDEDFRHTRVVTMQMKIVAGLILFCLNVFFAYYSILFGFTHGIGWQREYLFACIAQMLIEVFINESLECIWMNFFVPTLVSSEVQSATGIIIDTVNQLCKVHDDDTNGGKVVASKHLLNAPDYLFVSTNVAKAYPTLMESIIIQTYSNHLPGELAKKWTSVGFMNRMTTRHNHRSNNIIGISAVFVAVLSLMQYAATAPYMFQRMFVRFCQPFLLSGIIVLFYAVIRSPIYIAIFLAVMVSLVVLVIYNYCYHVSLQSKGKMHVRPIQDKSEADLRAPVGNLHDIKLGIPYSNNDNSFNGYRNDDNSFEVIDFAGYSIPSHFFW
eukprot:CAMPEP_0170104498 /NCGR_PEP_ID=MMETSP0020_2-20130122/4173_1 /TAXON_ID=98059 /ORGANISM="Dinobryon sp., Strain UTEXLB2267" /LENGTH=1127 /DNA_ID=CAMNT_0010328363 /DNA_START=712 /DNA_END=4092 /DNA_ORIENTATION=+